MSKEEIPEDRRAKPGHIWQCQACGKVAEDRYGEIGHYSYGWDVSCVMNSIEVPRKDTRQKKGD